MSVILSRKQHRQAFRRGVLVSCQVVREHDFKRVSYLALDLSTEGMMVATNDRVLTGEEMIVTFRAPFGRRWFDAQATVARVIHGRRPGDPGRALGLQFHGHDDAWRSELFGHLRGLPARGPTRPMLPQPHVLAR